MRSYFRQTQDYLAEKLQEARVDHEAFEQKLLPCELSRCKATCCHDGVYLSKEEAQLMVNLLGEFSEEFEELGLVRLTDYVIPLGEDKWKTRADAAEPEQLADDFPAHFPKTRCVFLDSQHRCYLQRLAVKQGKHPWTYKPFTCWIHPILLKEENGTLKITLVNARNDPQANANYEGFGSCTHCGRVEQGGEFAKDILENELFHLGKLASRDFLAQLNAPPANW